MSSNALLFRMPSQRNPAKNSARKILLHLVEYFDEAARLVEVDEGAAINGKREYALSLTGSRFRRTHT